MKPAVTFALFSSALLASALAPAQTPAPAAPKPAASATAAKKPLTPATGTAVARKGPPPVVGLPKTLYALKYVDTKIGTGPAVTTHHWLTVNYTGYFPDGTIFDSSLNPGREPLVFPYGAQRVIIGWDTGFEGMKAGGKRRLYVPYELAYGELGSPPKMPVKQALIFDVELISFSDKGPAPPPEPPAPSTPPPPPAGTAPGTPTPVPTPPNPASQPTTDPTKPTVDPKSSVPPGTIQQ